MRGEDFFDSGDRRRQCRRQRWQRCQRNNGDDASATRALAWTQQRQRCQQQRQRVMQQSAGTTKGREGGQEEWGGGHDAFATGRTVTKALFGDGGGRRQEGGVNTTISQKRDLQRRCKRQRQRNRQRQASGMKGQEGGATMMMQWRGMCAARWYNKEPLKILEPFWNRASLGCS
jgi:hypothetical protein